MNAENKFGEMVEKYMRSNGWTMKELGEKVGRKESTVSMWISKKSTPPMGIVQKLADLFGVTTDEMVYGDSNNTEKKPVRPTFRIPVLARVAAGIPIEAIEDIVDYEEANDLSGHEEDYFGLRVSGNSMEPRIQDGDTLIVKKQPMAENGQTVVVLVNGDEGCVKKLRWTETGMMLISSNPCYEPMVFTSDEIENLPVRIVGRVVEVRGKI